MSASTGALIAGIGFTAVLSLINFRSNGEIERLKEDNKQLTDEVLRLREEVKSINNDLQVINNELEQIQASLYEDDDITDEETTNKGDAMDQVMSLLSNTTSTIKDKILTANSGDPEKQNMVCELFNLIDSQFQKIANTGSTGEVSENISEELLSKARSMLNK